MSVTADSSNYQGIVLLSSTYKTYQHSSLEVNSICRQNL